ncbi:hypothetical protein [Micromonospora peucetia]|uniref:hypothetical protein n=1 Tax=Micromonospora peucetia TaxID=47871 RepID=UPI00268952E9|nr:hypothetical protein [Micromonospora peucetia]
MRAPADSPDGAAASTAADRMPPALLFTHIFALGVGQALTLSAWQASIPELVPRS